MSAALGLLVLTLVWILWMPAPAEAMPPRPPRPTAPPTITPPSPDTTPQRTLIVLSLALTAGESQTHWQELWTVVQWQDGQGDWHDVTGWRGGLDEFWRGVGQKTWVVEDKHLGRGPFRWSVYYQLGGALSATSQPFYLPSASGGVAELQIAL